MTISRSQIRKLATWGLGGLAFFAIMGFLVLPPILKWVLTKQLTERLHRTVTIQDIQINPFFLSIRIAGFSVKDLSGEATFLGFEELFADAQIVSLVKGGPVLREVRLKAPQVSIVRNEDETYNFSDLLETFGSKPAAATPSEKESKPFRFSVNNIQLAAGRVEFEDKPKAAHHTVQDIRVAIPSLSNLPYDLEIFVEPAFEAIVNDTPLRLSGKTKPFHDTLETTLDINVSGIDIPKYLAYLPVDLPVRIPSATMGVQAELSFIRAEGKGPSLGLEGQVELKNLAVTDRTKQPILTLPLLRIGIDSDEILVKKVHLTSVVVQSPELHVRRDRAGTLNLAALAPKTSTPQSARPEATPQKPKTTAPSVSLEVDQAKLSGARVRFVDETTTPVFRTTIESINLDVSHFRTAKDSRANVGLNLTLNKKGTIKLTGSVAVDPLSAQLKTELKNLDWVPFQPYLNDRINVILTSGSLTTKGDVELTMTTEQKPAISFAGETAVTKFTLLDEGNSEELLKWSSLALNGVRVHTEPQKIDVQQVALTDFYSRLIVNPDGTLNVQGLVKRKAAPGSREGAEATAPETSGDGRAKPIPIAIKAVTLQGGTVDFTDRFVKPNFTANMTNMGGRVSGLSSEENRRAGVEFRGQLRNQSPLEITGTISPLSRDLFADIKMDFKDIELSPMTPYAAKYAGYAIQKGKLSLSLNYHIENRKLSADHHLYIDQFNFGDRVESSDATNLPVRLAVSLLTDRNGIIDLNFPVSGSLDDPEFSVWGVIIQVVKNLLVKAATSPFSLIQALVGENVELSHLEFDFGKAQLAGAAPEKLNALGKVLTERPALNVEIIGHVDVEKDREGLRQERFERKVKAQKLNDLVKRGEPELSIDTIRVSPDEYEEYLSKAYKQETFPKPKNVLGLTKSLPVPEMEKLMLTHLEMTEDDLRQLAGQRAQAVKDYLVTVGKIDSQRLFLVEAKTLAPERKEKLKDSRVDFALR